MNGRPSSRSGPLSADGIDRGLDRVREVIDRLRPDAAVREDLAESLHEDVRADVLAVLAEEPANGYRVVRLLEERGDGRRTPTAGAVYPVLQLLADEGLATAAESDGRRTWTLTAAGRAAAEAGRDRPAAPAAGRQQARPGGIVRSAAQLTQTAALAAQTVRGEQAGEIVAVLDEARRRVLVILARG